LKYKLKYLKLKIDENNLMGGSNYPENVNTFI